MIGTAPLAKILQTIGATSFVDNGRGAISIKLIAPSDAGKSELLLSNLPRRARILDDLTTASLFNIMDVRTPPKWIVIPDLNKVMSHKPTVANLTFAQLLSLLGEGITEIPGVEGPAKIKAQRLRARGITVALLTAVTPDMFFHARRQWKATGLLRRLVPLYYTYSQSTQAAIQASIRQGADELRYEHKYLPVVKSREVEIPPAFAKDIEKLSESVTLDQLRWTKNGDGEHDGPNSRYVQAADFPFSVQKTLRQYVRAHALLRGHRTCDTKDMSALGDFARFVRYDRPERI